MGFFDLKAICVACDSEVGLNRNRIANKEWLCPSCTKKLGKLTKPMSKMTIDDVRASMASAETNQNELESFNPTKKIGAFIEFDDTQQKWLVPSGLFRTKKKSIVYDYSDIVDFELLEDGESISSGGLGRALVGGVLFGGAGAVVGGVTGKKATKGICKSMKIKITVNDMNNPVVYVDLISSATKKDSIIYKTFHNSAQECLSVLQLICDRQSGGTNTTNIITGSNADEIKKYKNLLDEGILTQEEFNAKKKELLGL